MAPTLLVIDTPLLHIAVEVSGPGDGRPVMLLHGWPDDVRTWDRILPALHQAGFRTIVPYLRGYGPTRFRSAGTMRSGQLAALGQDALDLAGALGLPQFDIVGHDWGARAAYIASCLAPDRIRSCCGLSVGWGTNDPGQTLGLKQIQNYWYHWYMALDRGAELVRHDSRAFTRHLWAVWAPDWPVGETEFDATAASFDNPDWAEIVIHSYRVRWGLAARDPAYDHQEARLAADPTIRVPALTLHGAADPCNAPETSEGKEHLFAGPYRRVSMPGAGHFPQREMPEAVAGELLAFLVPGDR